MKYARQASLWLSALSAIVLAGCSTLTVNVDEPSQWFSEVELPSSPTLDRVQLPLEPDLEIAVVEGQEVFILTPEGMTQLEAFVIAAYANEDVLDAAQDWLGAQHAQLEQMALIGQATEAQAAIFRSAYINEAQSCRWLLAGGAGLSAAALILMGVSL